MEKTKLFLYGFLGILLIFLCGLMFLRLLHLETQEIAVTLTVASSLGVNTDTDALHLGRVGPGSVSFRDFNVTSSFTEEIKVVLDLETEEPSWYNVSAPEFILLPGESRKVTLQASVPATASYKSHNSTLLISYWKTI